MVDETGDAGAAEDGPARRVGAAEVVRAAFDEMPVMLAAMEGPDHRFVAVNNAFRTFTGRDDVIGVPIREVFPEVVGQQMFEILDRVYATGRPETGRESRTQLDVAGTGTLTESYVDFTISPRAAGDGSSYGVSAIVLDVTERVRRRLAADREAAEVERQYRAARDVVAALQEALLPTALPVLPGVRIGARYLVAAHDQAAGGDWFDAVPLPDGKVALVVGDVVGHGVAASAAMGQLRAVVNHLVTERTDLAEALGEVNQFAARSPGMRAATLAVVLLDPATGVMRYSLCGHPAPLVVGVDGASARFLASTGSMPLGTGGQPDLATDELAPDELVLLYSDGLVERPGRDIRDGMANLATAAADAAANRVFPVGAAPTAAERVCQLTVELLTRTGYGDDVTTLAAERLVAPFASVDIDLPNRPESLTRLRAALAAWLDQIQCMSEDRYALDVAVGELVTNAVEHAYPEGAAGDVRVEAHLDRDGYVRCTVTDNGRWREPETAPARGGRGLLLARRLVDELRIQHPPQPAGEPPGARGTIASLAHRPHRPAMLASRTVRLAEQPPEIPYTTVTDVDDDGPRVRVRGPVDLNTADRLAVELLAASRGGVRGVTVDLTEVTHLASAGVRALFEVGDQLAAHRQRFTVVSSAGSPARAVTDLVGLPASVR